MMRLVPGLVGFENTLIPEVSEKFAPWHIFHKDAQVFGVLADAVEVDLD